MDVGGRCRVKLVTLETEMAAAAAAVGMSSPQHTGGGVEDGEVRDGAVEDGEAEVFLSESHCSELAWRQNEQRKQGLFCDMTLVFGGGGREFPAHRSVLAAATDYFAPLLSGQFEESRSGRVEMKWSSEPGPDLETVEAVIQYMYTGQIRVCTGNVHEVLELSDR